MSESKEMFVPGRFESQIADAVGRYLAWKGGDECVAFTVVTDVHSYIGGISDPPNYRDPKMHIPLALCTADRIDADFAADLGDQDFDTPCLNVPNILARIESARAMYSAYASRPVLFCVGNHDCGYEMKGCKGHPMPPERFGEVFSRMASRRGFGVVHGDNPTWGYYDIAAKRTRVFFVNSSDTGYYGFSKGQLDFLSRSLCATPDGWTVLVLEHFTPLQGYKVRRSRGQAPTAKTRFPRTDAFAEMLLAFVACGKGSLGDVEWDFRGLKGRDVRLAGCICGDAHWDLCEEVDGVHYAITQGYGKFAWEQPVSLRQMRGTVHEFVDCEKEVLFEIVAVKPARHELHMFRVGAGGSARDREWRY